MVLVKYSGVLMSVVFSRAAWFGSPSRCHCPLATEEEKFSLRNQSSLLAVAAMDVSSLLAKRPSRQGARRDGCFRRLGNISV